MCWVQATQQRRAGEGQEHSTNQELVGRLELAEAAGTRTAVEERQNVARDSALHEGLAVSNMTSGGRSLAELVLLSQQGEEALGQLVARGQRIPREPATVGQASSGRRTAGSDVHCR